MSSSRKSSRRPRKRSLQVHVHVHEHTFVMACGSGDQSFKWLALAAAQRYRQLSLTNGRLRQRENLNSNRGVFTPRALVSPRSREESRGSYPSTATPVDYLPPDAKLKDLVATGDHVYLELNREGGPCMSRWSDEAFSGNRESKQNASKARMEEKMEAIERKRLEREAAAAERAAAEREARKREEARLARNPFAARHTESAKELQQKCAKDWASMKLERVLRSEGGRATVAGMLSGSYRALRALFNYYCAYGAGDLGTMSRAEFLRLLQENGVLDSSFKSSQADAVFVAANNSGGGGGSRRRKRRSRRRSSAAASAENPDNELVRAEFFEALVRCAVAKYDDEAPEARVQRLFDALCVFGDALLSSQSELRGALQASEVLEVYQSRMEPLRSVFRIYQSADERIRTATDSKVKKLQIYTPRPTTASAAGGGGGGDDTICYPEFALLLIDAGVVYADREDPGATPITERIAKQIFIACQGSSADDESGSTELDFPEFLESLASLARYRLCQFQAPRPPSAATAAASVGAGGRRGGGSSGGGKRAEGGGSRGGAGGRGEGKASAELGAISGMPLEFALEQFLVESVLPLAATGTRDDDDDDE